MGEINSLLIKVADGSKLGDVSNSKDRKRNESMGSVLGSQKPQHAINDRKITRASGSLGNKQYLEYHGS